METYNTILQRRSIRKFTDQAVSNDIIQQLLKAAMAAPSACNKRPWEFYVIKNNELQSQLKKSSKFAGMNSNVIIIVAGNTNNSLSKKDNDFWIQDCSAAVENILLVATENNIGTCWCGLYPNKLAANRVRKILNIENHIIPMALIHLGYPAEEKESRTQFEESKVHIYE